MARLGPVAWLTLLLLGSGDGGEAARPGAAPVLPGFTILGRVPDPRDITYRIDPRGSGLEAAEARRTLRRAMSAWEEHGVRFRAVGEEEQPYLELGWRQGRHGSCPPFIGWCGQLAHASLPGEAAFVHFNADVSWGSSRRPGLYVTALHEIGHVLGLGHGPRDGSLMSLRYDAAASPGIGATERDAIASLYGGGGDAPGDVRVLRWTDSGLRDEAPRLRGVAPSDRVSVRLFDADGDGADELFTLPRRHTDLTCGLGCFDLDGALRLERAVGPVYGVVRNADETFFAEADDGSRLLVRSAGERRYRALRFTRGGLPLEVRRTAPLRLKSGHVDDDGDGAWDTLPPSRDRSPPAQVESLYPGYRIHAAGREGPGQLLLLREGASGRRFVVVGRRGEDEGWVGEILEAADALLGDLDGDGRDEVVAVTR